MVPRETIRETIPWFERVRTLPAPLRLAAVIVPMLVVLAAGLLPGALSAVQLQLLMLATVLVGALAQGLAAGLAGATLGFGVMLWRAVEATPGDGWILSFQAAFDAFLWFAVAKLAAALVAAPQGVLARHAEARRQAEAEARRRELLLTEMSHRVSNDMSLLVSLLQMQATADPETADALHAAAGRVYVLSRVHGRLSPGAQPDASVDSRLFLEELVADLRAGVGGVRPVALTVAAEAHALPLARAADIGLVVNELVTNALKHAFPDRRDGVVRVTFRRDDDAYELVVADNGVGTVPGPAARDAGGGLGSQILRALAAQLGGRLERTGGEVGGTMCRLRFPVPRQGLQQAFEYPAMPGPRGEARPWEAEPEPPRRRRG